MDDGHDAQPTDVMAAYQLLLTTRRLVDPHHLQVDDIVQSAMDWLVSLPDSREDSWLLGTGTATAQEAKELVGFLSQRDAIIYKRLAQRTSEYIAEPESAAMGCAHVGQMQDFFSRLPNEKAKLYDPDGSTSFETLIGTVVCKARSLTAMARAKESPTQLELDRAELLYNKIAGRIEQETGQKRNTSLRQQAEGRAADLRQVLEHFKAIASAEPKPGT